MSGSRLPSKQPGDLLSRPCFPRQWREYRGAGLYGKMGTVGGLSSTLLLQDRVPCLTVAVAIDTIVFGL